MADETISSSSQLKSIDIDSVRNFFNQYIKNYLPYSESKVYDTIIDNLVEYYYNQLYNVIPSQFKELFDTANISSPTLYDNLLIAVGLPKQLVRQMTFPDKIIFLKTLSDFQRYKASLSFVENLGEAYKELNKVNIYELYVDYDDTLTNPWILKPVNIYKHKDVDLRLTSLDYLTAYNQIPTLLLSVDQLNTHKADGQLILPIKSNLLLLDYDLSQHVSLLYDLIVVIFLREYKNNIIDIFFSDRSLASSLKSIYYAWYYLMTRYYETTWESLTSSFVLKFIYDNDFMPFPYTIDDVDILIAEYNNIETTEQRDNFYTARLSNVFSGYTSIVPPTDDTQMLTVLNYIDPDLATYLDNRISQIENLERQKLEINTILTEIYHSLALYSQSCGIPKFSQYSSYFLSYLPQIVIRPEDTTTYLLLDNIKPFHTELYTRSNTGIFCQDKFNSVILSDVFSYLIQVWGGASAVTLSSQNYFLNMYQTIDNSNVIDYVTNVFSYLNLDLEQVTDISSFFAEALGISMVTLSTIYYLKTAFQTTDNMNIIDSSLPSLFSFLNLDTEEVTDDSSTSVKALGSSILTLSTIYCLLNTFQTTDNLSIIDYIVSLFSYLNLDTEEITDDSLFSTKVPVTSVAALGVIYYLLNEFQTADNVNIVDFIVSSLFNYLNLDIEEVTDDSSSFAEVPGASAVALSSINSLLNGFLSTGSDNVSIIDDYVVMKIP